MKLKGLLITLLILSGVLLIAYGTSGMAYNGIQKLAATYQIVLPQPPKAPKAPTFSSAPCGGYVVINWVPVKSVIAYNVYRSTSAKDKYIKITATGATTLTFTDSPGTGTFFYKISAVGGGGESVKSSPSLSITPSLSCGTPPPTPTPKPPPPPISPPVVVPKPPSPPAQIIATPSSACGGTIDISWSASTSTISYRLYRDESINPLYSGTALAYKDIGLSPSSTHTYRVIAANNIGSSATSSSVSTNASKACLPPPPTPPTNFKVMTSSSCGGKVELSWSPVASSTAYHIYRSRTATGGFSEIVGSGGLNTSLTDETSRTSTVLYYMISASNEGGESGFSSVISTLSSDICRAIQTGTGSSSLGFSWGNNPYGGSVGYINEGITINGWDGIGEPSYVHHDDVGNVVVPTMLFSVANGGEDYYNNNVRLYYSLEDNGGNLKVPINIDGEWDGQTYYWLYPASDLDGKTGATPLVSPDEGNARTIKIYADGVWYEVWADYIPNVETYPSNYFDYPIEGITLRTPQFFPLRGVVPTEPMPTQSPLSILHAGGDLPYPVTIPFKDAMIAYWRVKNWEGLINQSSLDRDGNRFATPEITHNVDSLAENEVELVSKNSIATDMTYYPRGNNGLGGYDTSHIELFSGMKGARPDDTRFHFEGGAMGRNYDELVFKDRDYGGAVTYSMQTPTGNFSKVSEVLEGDVSQTFGSVILKYKSCWTYGGKYDAETCEPVSTPSSPSITSNFFKSIISWFNTVTRIHLASLITTWFDINTTNQVAQVLPNTSLTFQSKGLMGVTSYGGNKDVQIDAEGYALENDNPPKGSKCQFKTRARYLRAGEKVPVPGGDVILKDDILPPGANFGDLIKFPSGRTRTSWACIGYHEKGSVSGKYMHEYDTANDWYAAYPLDNFLPKSARTGKGNNAVLKEYYLQIENPQTGQYLNVPIVDRGPAWTDVIDVSEGVITALGFSNNKKVKQAKVTLVKGPIPE